MNHLLLEQTWELYKVATHLDREDNLVKSTIDDCYRNLAAHYGVSKPVIKKVLERLYEDCYDMYCRKYYDVDDFSELHYSYIDYLRGLFDEELYNYLNRVNERRAALKEG